MEMRLTIDVTPRVEALLTRLAEVFGQPPIYPGSPVQASEPSTAEAEPAAEPSEPAAPAEPSAPSAPSAPEYPDDEELKQHMDMTISRFAGNGWREAKDQRSLAIRKGCAAVFKDIAKWLGAEKPTHLQDEKRLEFVARLKEVFIEEEEGKIPVIVFRPF